MSLRMRGAATLATVARLSSATAQATPCLAFAPPRSTRGGAAPGAVGAVREGAAPPQVSRLGRALFSTSERASSAVRPEDALAAVSGPTLFIDGQWRQASDSSLRPTVNPFNQAVLREVDEASVGDAEQAVTAARAFFDSDPWSDPSQTSYAERAQRLTCLAELLQHHKPVLATLETLDTGKTLAESEADIDDVTSVCRFYAQEARKYDMPRVVQDPALPASMRAAVSAGPVGVCVLIMPWNYPILQLFWKLAPALVAGNAMVLKPSEVTPLSTVFVVRYLLRDPSMGLPAGAVQLLTAHGSRVGSVLTESSGVDLVSFTGGLATGRKVLASCAGTVKQTHLELGGKNPQVVFSDVDLDWAADVVATSVFVHSGQVCSSATRLIVDEAVADDLVARVVAKAQRIALGSGLDPRSETGPLVSRDHLAKVQAYVDLGISEGAHLLTGGMPPDPVVHPSLAKGNFFLPTVFDRCDRRMRIVQEETFGPVLTVERFPHNDETAAIALANDTRYGLAAGVQSSDQARAERVARKIRAGTLWVNTYGPYSSQAEWGGGGWSGTSRELGEEGLRAYLSVKSTFVETKPAPMNWFGTQ